MSQCSPKRKGNKHCLTRPELLSVARLYEKNNNVNIDLTNSKSDADILKQMKKTTKCKNEVCILDKTAAHTDRNLYDALIVNFKPAKPREWQENEREWLNTNDILHVMRQYEDKHLHFKFLGVFPVDFRAPAGPNVSNTKNCVVKSMCEFDIHSLRAQNKNSFGIVFNLDRHDQPGSHWVSMFCNIDPSAKHYGMCFYDSAGMRPPKLILDFMKYVKKQMNDVKFKGRFNNIQHQFKNTECGIFSMLFITMCLEHTKMTYRQVRARLPKDKGDKKIHEFRDRFYRDAFYNFK